MRRLVHGESASETPNRHSAAVNNNSLVQTGMIATLAATTLLFMLREQSQETGYPPRILAHSVSYEPETMNRHVHSGPFRLEGFDHDIYFLGDGFTIAFADQSFRIERLQAYWSDMTLEQIFEKLNRRDVERIECDSSLIMHAGPDRSLEIAQSDFIRILEAMQSSMDASITIPNVPYNLNMKMSISTVLVPRKGVCDLTLGKMKEPTMAIASTNR
jgi:hypothetical protein